MKNNIHSCSYYCHIPECIKAQRDELRDKFVDSDTHRVVSVAILQRLLEETIYYASKKELQTIINKELS